MKFYKKYISLRYWLAFLRRQPVHLQHMYAVAISATVTAILAAAILYFDYGFWHERYSRSDAVITDVAIKATSEVETASPGELFGDFFKEASSRVQALKDTKSSILEGKETYINEGVTTENTEFKPEE